MQIYTHSAYHQTKTIKIYRFSIYSTLTSHTATPHSAMACPSRVGLYAASPRSTAGFPLLSLTHPRHTTGKVLPKPQKGRRQIQKRYYLFNKKPYPTGHNKKQPLITYFQQLIATIQHHIAKRRKTPETQSHEIINFG